MGKVFGKTFDVCEDVYQPEEELQTHNDDVHPLDDSKEQLNCPHCDKTYKSEQTLLKHIETKHPPENE